MEPFASDLQRFTLGGLPLEPVYGPPTAPTTALGADRRARRSTRSPAAFTPPAIAADRGRSASSPASATRRRPTSDTA